MNSDKKLRILCLHGYHQNKDTFREKIGSFRKPLKKYADFEFLDAPHVLKDSCLQETPLDREYLQKISAENCTDGRAWWLKDATDGESDGFQESLDLFKKTLNESGPFDGVMGFSQGAAFLALACIVLKEKLYSTTVKFLIFVAGFKSIIPAHAKFYQLETKVNIPSLHVTGETDEVTTSDRSRELSDMFNNSQLVTHKGGHYVAVTRELKDVYKQFLKKFYINT